MNKNLDIVAIILAGGLSSRMGTNKAFLKINGVSFIDHAIKILKNIGIDNIFISGDLPNYSCIPDQFKTQGPVEGIRSSFMYLKNHLFHHALFLAIDEPLLNENILRKLIDCYFKQNNNYFSGFPLPFLIKKENGIQAFEKNRPLNSIFSFLQAVNCNVIEPSEEEKFILKGVNTMEEWEFIKNYEH